MNGGTAVPQRHSGDATLRIILEIFFVALPMLFMWVYWPADGHTAKSFWHTPELSAAALVFYGLTVSRLISTAIARAANLQRIATQRYVLVALVVGFVLGGLTLAPMQRLFHSHTGTLIALQSVNFVVSVLFFLVLARHAARYGVD